jgi:hypothetical protein
MVAARSTFGGEVILADEELVVPLDQT